MIQPPSLKSVKTNLKRSMSPVLIDTSQYRDIGNKFRENLTKDFKPASGLSNKRVDVHGDSSSRVYKLVGILFCQPSHPLSKSEVTENIRYFHYRSGKNIDFYCAGYGASWVSGEYQDKELVISVGDQDWYFSAAAFNEFRVQIEEQSKWKYSGEVELLLINSYCEPRDLSVFLDFNSTIVCRLDEMKRIEAIASVMSFFEDIFQYAEQQDRSNPAWGFSDRQALSQAGSVLKTLVLSLLPKKLGADLDRLRHFAILDLGQQ